MSVWYQLVASHGNTTLTTRFGASAALATPFNPDGSIDIKLLVAHARTCLEQGCRSVTLFGTTGEGASIGDDERDAVFDAMLAGGITGSQLVAGVLVSAAADAASQARRALDRGVRNILLAPPSYFKGISEDGLFRWFADVFAAIGPGARDVLVYNIPSVTQVQIGLEVIARLREAFPAVVTGVKDSGGDWSYSEALLQAQARDMVILIGDERHLAQAVQLGAEGAISGMANYATQAIAAMCEDGTEDSRVTGYVEALLRHPVIPAVKATLAACAGDDRWLAVRAPLDVTPPDVRAALATRFEKLFGTAR